MTRARRPWYGFLYYLLGAQGSFLAWLVSGVGVYFTWREAALFILNPEPRDVSVADLVEGSGRFRRWLRVKGVEIDLGSALFALSNAEAALPDGRPSGPVAADGRRAPPPSPDTVIADHHDAASAAWRELFRRIDELERGAAETEAQSDARLLELWSLIQEVGTEKQRARFFPGKALVVVENRPRPTTVSAAPPEAAALEVLSPVERQRERWRRRTAERIELIRRSVRIDVEREGLLQPGRDLAAKYKKNYGVVVAQSALVVGDHPSKQIAMIFAGFATVLFLLLIGLRALGAPDESAGPPDAPA